MCNVSVEFMGNILTWGQYSTLWVVWPTSINAPVHLSSTVRWLTSMLIWLLRGPLWLKFLIFLGRIGKLFLNSARWWWLDQTSFKSIWLCLGKHGLPRLDSHQTYCDEVAELCSSPYPKWNVIWHNARLINLCGQSFTKLWQLTIEEEDIGLSG